MIPFVIAQKKRQIIFTLEMEILNLDENLQQSLVTRTQTIRETSVAVKMMRKEEEKKSTVYPLQKSHRVRNVKTTCVNDCFLPVSITDL